ncbi:MAG: hypothetical protein M3Q97_11210 [Bacteroidota bacterium]|nr:hypothetical protein [Bacteroidota bacterium]
MKPIPMRKNLVLHFLFIALLCSSFTTGMPGSAEAPACEIMKNGTFDYVGIPHSEAYIVIEGDQHAEYYQDGKYYVKSRLEWIDECTFQTTVERITVPEFSFGLGDHMTIKITKVKKGIIEFEGKTDKEEFSGKLKKVE